MKGRKKGHVVVVGSSNTDLVAIGKTLPRPGETVIQEEFIRAAGGKGANKAVAAARAGAEVTLITAVGDDTFGHEAIEGFKVDGIDTSFIPILWGVASGIALIVVDSQGENMIAVAPGANALLSPAHVNRAESVIKSADVILACLEVPIPSVDQAFSLASEAGKTVILNPAPAPEKPLSMELLKKVTYLTPNETEFSMIVGDSDINRFLREGPNAVVLTRGREGVILFDGEGKRKIPAFKAEAVDTVGAGDAFSGAFAAALAEGQSVEDALRFAQAAAAISVTRVGAQPSMPKREEILELIE